MVAEQFTVRRGMKRHIALFTLVSVIALLVLPIAPVLAQTPVYTQTIGDAITGDNPLQNQSGPQNACKSNQCRFPDDGADSYTAELWERPMNQQQDLFYPAFDITQAQLGSDSEWYYFKINVYGGNEPYPFYGWEIGTNGDPRGGLFIRADEPQKKNSSYGSQSLIAWHDGNNTVGAGTTNAPDGPGNTDGFEDKVFDQSGSDVRVRASGSVIEFAARKSFVHQYVSATNISHRGWALKGGVNDPTKLYGHDVYDRSQAGSPYPYLNTAGAPDSGTANNAKSGNVNPFYPTGNIYEIDNTQWLTIQLPPPTIEIIKSGPTNAVRGSTITYTMDVRIPSGSVPLTNVVVTDPDCTAGSLQRLPGAASGDTDNDNVLDLSETWHYTCSRTIAGNAVSPLPNLATATGTGNGQNVTDTDPHEVILSNPPQPVVQIVKDGPTSAVRGTTITYTMDVSIPSGNLPLHDVVVTDPDCNTGTLNRLSGAASGDTNSDNILQVSEVWHYKCERTIALNAPSPLPNTARVDAKGPNNEPVFDTDPHSVVLSNPVPPVVQILKDGPSSAVRGSTITYTMDVSIPSGNLPLHDVVVTDPDCNTGTLNRLSGAASGDTNGDNILQFTEVWHYTCQRTIANNAPSPLPNTATVNAKGPNNEPVTDDDPHSVTLTNAPVPVVQIVKGGPASALRGDTITYTMDVSIPSGNLALHDVVVSDPDCNIGSIARLAGIASGDTNGDNILQFTEVWHYTCLRTISLTAPSPLPNTARVDAKGPNNEPVFDTDPHSVVVSNPPSPVVQIVKDGPSSAVRGSTITYTMDVSIPSGNLPLHDVVVTDPDCNASTLIRLTGAASGDTNTDNILQVSEVWHYKCERTIALNAPSPLPNTARVDAKGPNNEPVFDTDPHSVVLTNAPVPVVQIVKDGPSLAQRGSTISYTMDVSIPSGNLPLHDVVVTDPDCNPSTLVRLSGAASGDSNSDNILQVGEVWHYTCRRTIALNALSPLPNIATVNAKGPNNEPVTDDDPHSVTLTDQPVPVIEIIKSGPTEAQRGSTITYTMDVRIPSGTTPLTNVVVTDPDCNPGTILRLAGAASGDSNNDNILQSTETWHYTCQRTISQSATSPLPNTATATGVGPNNQTVTDTDDHLVILTQQPPNPQIIIEKSGPQTAKRGDEITYTLRVSIPVDRPLTNVTVTDPKCDSTPVLVSRSGGDQDDVLELGEVWTYTCKHRITALDADPLPNTAVATGRDDRGNEVRDDDDHLVDLLPGPPTPAIDIEKDGPARAQRGDTITYRLSVSIPIDRPLTNVVVSDPRCDDAPELVSKTGGDNDDTLEFGEIWNYRCTHRVRAGDPNPLPNTATATGVDEAGTQVTDQDSHLVDLVAPADIRIEKDGPQEAEVGDTIVYTLEVSIPIDHPLTNVEVSDPRCDNRPTLDNKRGGDDDNVLEFGETWVYHCDHLVLDGEVGVLQNTATATGDDENGDTVRDRDDHDVEVAAVLGEIDHQAREPTGRDPSVHRLVFDGPDRLGLRDGPHGRCGPVDVQQAS